MLPQREQPFADKCADYPLKAVCAPKRAWTFWNKVSAEPDSPLDRAYISVQMGASPYWTVIC
jgi:hypothetical protein